MKEFNIPVVAFCIYILLFLQKGVFAQRERAFCAGKILLHTLLRTRIPKSCYLCKPLPQEAAETIIEETIIMMDKKTIAGYAAGIACGVSYGMNPLFAKHLLAAGVPVDTMLFLRYAIAALILGFWILLGKQRSALRLRPNQLELLALLGMLFAFSSLFLFDSYAFIPSGLATTIVFLYPVFTAIIMVFLKVYPSWQNWVAIAATFAGVVILSIPSGGVSLKWQGLLLAALSALAYSFYLVTVNRSRRLRSVPNMVLTFYALLFGSLLFLAHHVAKGGAFFAGIPGLDGAAGGAMTASGAVAVWLNLIGLAVVPTLISMLTLAISTRYVGPVKTAVLGVFEPLTAILIGSLLFGEPLTSGILAGIGITIAAVVFMVAGKSEKRPGESV